MFNGRQKFNSNHYLDETLLNRNDLPDNSAFVINITQARSNNYTRDAKQTREDFVEYFNSPMQITTKGMTTTKIPLNLMATIYFTNHQKRLLVDFLKKCPCIVYVKNCLECQRFGPE